MSSMLRILSVEDEKEQHDILKKVFSKPISQKKIEFKVIGSLENAIDEITKNDYHIVILDIYRGKPDDNNEEGEKILETVQRECLIPIIFYSGNTKNVKRSRSQMVGVITKAEREGIENLKEETERLVKSNLPFTREKIHSHLEKEFKEYFWNIIHERKNIFRTDEEDLSLGYLMLCELGYSLSKEKIAEILDDNTLTSEKAHPMRLYTYPTDTNQEFERGEIIKSKENNEFFVILTPSHDFIKTSSRRRKTERILLVEASLLGAADGCEKYTKEKASKPNENELRKLINSSKSDRYFFLSKTPFIGGNRVTDFQSKEMVSYEDPSNPEKYERIVKLDSSFAEPMVASLTRYYNCIGFPDIDTDYILSNS